MLSGVRYGYLNKLLATQWSRKKNSQVMAIYNNNKNQSWKVGSWIVEGERDQISREAANGYGRFIRKVSLELFIEHRCDSSR